LYIQILKINDIHWKTAGGKDFKEDLEYKIRKSGYPHHSNLAYTGDGSVYFGRGGKVNKVDINYPSDLTMLSRQ